MGLVDVKNLSVWYGDKSVKALENISISFTQGDINVILGSNGAGKSSLLRCLGGYQIPNQGQISIDGKNRLIDHKNFNQGVVLISEDIDLPLQPLTEIVEIYKHIWPKFDATVFKRIVSWASIDTSKRTNSFSKGQKILIQFALGMATLPKVILIDEVTAALDPYVRSNVANELIEYSQKNKATVILATNIATEFDHYDVQIFMIKSNSVYMSGKISELRKNFVKVKISNASKEKFKNDGFSFLKTSSDGMSHMIGIAKSKETIKTEISDEIILLEDIFRYLSDKGES